MSLPLTKRCIQSLLSVYKISNDDIQRLNSQLCCFVVTSEGSFSMVDHPELKRFFELLHPGVPLTDRNEWVSWSKGIRRKRLRI